jgi:predicted RNA-binding protein associated with RNAse of E/G family
VVDVGIVLPVRWVDGALEEVDLELDVLRSADGAVRVHDRDEIDRVRAAHAMPADVAAQAEETCERVREPVERGAEPFGDVGRTWLARFLAEAAAARPW